MKDKDLLKLLEKNGWAEERIKGSHHVMKKDGKTEIISFYRQYRPTGNFLSRLTALL